LLRQVLLRQVLRRRRILYHLFRRQRRPGNFQCRQRRKSQFHFVLHEHEDVIDRGFGAIAMQRHIPLQEAVLGLQLVKQRHIIREGHGEAGAELAQIIQQIERVRSIAENVAVKFQAKLPP
jgi:hypothetical protein